MPGRACLHRFQAASHRGQRAADACAGAAPTLQLPSARPRALTPLSPKARGGRCQAGPCALRPVGTVTRGSPGRPEGRLPPAPGTRGCPVPVPALVPQGSPAAASLPPVPTSPQYRDRRSLAGTDPRIQNGGASSPRRRPLHITGQAGGTAGGRSRLAPCPPLPTAGGGGEAAERGVRGARTGTPAPIPRTDVETGAP